MVHMKHAADTRKPYSGLSRSLVIAIDVGTTFSGVSYAILEPGEIPKIHGVTRFPGQEHVAGNSKIPSVIYYDKHGTIMAAGAEADSSSIAAQAEDEGWIKVELFKLRLRPRTMQLNMNGMRLSPLPRRKTPVHVFGDFLAYLFSCTRSFITDTHANGASLWSSVEPDIQLVLSHPNGWEGPQQTRMRNAAVYGRLVPDTDAGRARIRFVTEGEASLHACVLSGLAADVLSNPSKHGFLIVDAGGGTLDISAYAIKGTAPLAMEEIAPPDCIFAGSVFVSRRAREFLGDKLKQSKYGTPDSLDHITRKFDETTKRLFRDRNELQFIPFGSPLDKDQAVGIRSGQLRLTGNEVANLFEPSVDAAVTCIKAQIEASHGIIRSVFLVGGYAASPWLFGQLQERLAPLQITVSRPDTQTSKAVADGAIGFYCDHHVSARMSKFMYGVEFLRELNPDDPDHLARKERLCELPSGPKLLPDAFDCILARGVKVKESTVFTRKYCTELTNLSMLSVFEVEIWCYRGGNIVPKWISRHDDSFSTLCVVQADLSLLNGSAEPKNGRNGKKYWTIVFSVEIHFGLTEFKARIKWMDNGQVKYGPAVIVYNERGHRIEDDDIDVYPEDDQSALNDGRSGRRSEPVSRSRTPVDPYYPPGGSSRRTSNIGTPDVMRIEPSASKGYSPSITPSSRNAAYSTRDIPRGSDGERTGSDSERKKGKDREREYGAEDRDRGITPSRSATPGDRNRNSGYGAPSIAKGASSNGGGQAPEMLSSGWVANPSVGHPSSRSPSIMQPHSRSTSIYGGGGGHLDQSTPQDYASPPKSAVDEHRHSHLWGAPSAPQSAALDAILDRPSSPYVDRPKSPYAQDNNTFDRPKSPFVVEPAERSSSPFVHDQSTIGRSASPFVDRPKSGVEGSSFGNNDRLNSANFDDRNPAIFGNDVPPAIFGSDGPPAIFGNDGPPAIFGNDGPPSMFGDSGPAANDGGPALFGEPPASVFGETAAADDGWGFQAAAPTVASTPTTTKSGKSKRKGSAATTPGAATPASGLASRNSPSFGANKSPFGRQSDFATLEEPVVAAAGTSSPNAGLWGSKAPSPFEKKEKGLSPLNPASQIHNEPPVANDTLGWDFSGNSGGGGGGGGGDGWGNVNMDDSHHQEARIPSRAPSRAPSPAPLVHTASPVPPPSAPIEEPVPEPTFQEASTTKKKKKKGATPTTKSPAAPAQEVAEKEEEERKKAEAEKQAEAEKHAKEEREWFEREEAERRAQEEREREEGERVRKESEKLQADQLAAEMAETERQEAEKAQVTSLPSAFGNNTPMFSSGGLLSSSSLNPPDKPWVSTDTGGGDDGWGSWGAAPTTTKKKKGSKATTPVTPNTTKPSMFGSTGWGTFGSGIGDSSSPAHGPSPKPSPKPLAAELPSSQDHGIFNFSSSGPNLSFGGFDSTQQNSKVPSRAPSPAPAANDPLADSGGDPLGITSPIADGGEAEAWPLTGEGGGEKGDDEGAFTGSSKKKKKKKGGEPSREASPPPPATPQEDAAAETVAEPIAEPVAEPVAEPATTGGAGGKKKKKKK